MNNEVTRDNIRSMLIGNKGMRIGKSIISMLDYDDSFLITVIDCVGLHTRFNNLDKALNFFYAINNLSMDDDRLYKAYKKGLLGIAETIRMYDEHAKTLLACNEITVDNYVLMVEGFVRLVANDA